MDTNTSTPALTVAALPFLGGRIVRPSGVDSAIAVPVGTPAAEVDRLCAEYVATWRGAAHTTGALIGAPRKARTVGRRVHYTFTAVRAI